MVASEGDLLTRTSGDRIQMNAAYTWMAWVRRNANFGSGVLTLRISDSNIDYMRALSASNWSVRSIVAGAGLNGDSGVAVDTSWTHVTMRRLASGDELTILAERADGTSGTGTTGADNGSSRAATASMRVNAGAGSTPTAIFDLDMFAMKIWDVQLTDAEVIQERRTIRPVRLTNLWGWYPGLNTSNDRGGNGRDWTETGSVATGDNYAVAWGASMRLLPVGALAPAAPTLRTVHSNLRW
jgi:hypothetical protein